MVSGLPGLCETERMITEHALLPVIQGMEKISRSLSIRLDRSLRPCQASSNCRYCDRSSAPPHTCCSFNGSD